MTQTSIQIYEKEIFKKFQAIALEQGKSASEIIWQFITTTVGKLEGEKITLDKFTDPNYIQCPSILDSDEKIINFIKKQDTKTLEKLDTILYRAHVYARIFSSLPSRREMLAQMDYVSLWRNYYK